MDSMQHFRKLFEYNEWASREIMTALKAAHHVPPSALKRLAHVIRAERLWIARLEQKKGPVVWPELSLVECEQELAALPDLWDKFFDGMTTERLSARVNYVNTKGEPWTNTVEDILMHVILHSAYHRGQIAADIRGAGSEPANTDYIHAIRQSHVVG
jgi:uncharacterized damage-inducible protein DinB